MSLTITPVDVPETGTVTDPRGVDYQSLRLDVWVALNALADPTHQDRHWGKDLPGDDDYDSLAEHVACLYDECEILPRPERAVGSILRASEVPSMRLLGRHLGSLILDLGEAADSFYTTDPRWIDVTEAAEAAISAMES